MTETVLPGVLIEVRPEALIVPGTVTVNNVGVVGTAAKGPIDTPVLLGSYADAVNAFGRADRWIDGSKDELSLIRALELAFRFGASTVWAVRVSARNNVGDPAATEAKVTLASASGPCVTLTASSPGTWGNALTVTVEPATADAFVSEETVTGTPLKLAHVPAVQNAVNRIVVRPKGGGADLVPEIVYGGASNATQVRLDVATGILTFGTPPPDGATVLASYAVDRAKARLVRVKAGAAAEETFTVVSGDDLIADVNDQRTGSALLTATREPNSSELPGPAQLPDQPQPVALVGGTNGAAGADHQPGLDALLSVDAHLIVAAGMDNTKIGSQLAAHCAVASTDEIKRDRIAIVGTALAKTPADLVKAATGHTLNSDRAVLVTPGIRVSDSAQSPAAEITLPGAYTAAAVAGLLASQPPHISLTNKVLNVDGLEQTFSTAQLRQLVLARLLALENRQGFRFVRGITTSTNTAWQQITTRRIVDYAKFGVRAAATPYIGLLNNERVRAALRATINSFLATMVADEMLISYEIDVHASRADEIAGRALVDLVIRPTFSIDFIKVTMFLE